MPNDTTPAQPPGYRRSEFQTDLLDALQALTINPASAVAPTQAQIDQAIADYLSTHPLSGGGTTPPTQAQIDQAVADYLAAHPVSGGGTTGTGSGTTQPDLVIAVGQAGQTVFTLPGDNVRTVLFVNSAKALSSEFTISGTTLTWHGGYSLDPMDKLVLVAATEISSTPASGQAPLAIPVTQAGQTTFALPAGNLRTTLFVDSERADPLSYTIANDTLTWSGYYLLDPDDELLLT